VVFTWQNGDEGSVEKFSKRTVKVIVLPFFFKKIGVSTFCGKIVLEFISD
jgi:hypothetical protein